MMKALVSCDSSLFFSTVSYTYARCSKHLFRVPRQPPPTPSLPECPDEIVDLVLSALNQRPPGYARSNSLQSAWAPGVLGGALAVALPLWDPGCLLFPLSPAADPLHPIVPMSDPKYISTATVTHSRRAVAPHDCTTEWHCCSTPLFAWNWTIATEAFIGWMCRPKLPTSRSDKLNGMTSIIRLAATSA